MFKLSIQDFLAIFIGQIFDQVFGQVFDQGFWPPTYSFAGSTGTKNTVLHWLIYLLFWSLGKSPILNPIQKSVTERGGYTEIAGNVLLFPCTPPFKLRIFV